MTYDLLKFCLIKDGRKEDLNTWASSDRSERFLKQKARIGPCHLKIAGQVQTLRCCSFARIAFMAEFQFVNAVSL